ncbi:hypothetical protein ACVITL_003615 [Rhizobium pisi]
MPVLEEFLSEYRQMRRDPLINDATAPAHSRRLA